MSRDCNTCMDGKHGFCTIHHTVPGGCNDYRPDPMIYGMCGIEELKAKVRRKLERVRKTGPMGRREEGYEEALLAVLSMIHEIENRRE